MRERNEKNRGEREKRDRPQLLALETVGCAIFSDLLTIKSCGPPNDQVV